MLEIDILSSVVAPHVLRSGFSPHWRLLMVGGSGEHGCLGLGGYPEFLHDARQVRFRGGWGDHEALSDLLIGELFGDQLQNFLLAVGQTWRGRTGCSC